MKHEDDKQKLKMQQLLEQLRQANPIAAAAATCLVCYARLTHPGVTPCDHNEICALCHLRLRFLHQDMKCPICKKTNDLVIVDSYEDIQFHKLFGEYPTAWGDDEDHLYMGDAFVYRGDSVKMFFEKQYYEKEVVPLFGFKCHNCNEYTNDDERHEDIGEQDNKNKRSSKKKSGVKTTVRALQDHLKTQHDLSLCQLCVDHKRDFVAKLPRFTPQALQQHLRNGDGPHSGFSGHPICEFCRPTRFYDSSELFRHLQKEHYKCHVCEQQGLDHQYFRDYSSLAKHFERMHFLCLHASCLEIRFVVFSNELDLRKHLREIHGEAGGDAKLQLEFRYKSARQVEDQTLPSAQDFQYGLDGQAFVPEALVAGNNSSATNPSAIGMHPIHLERTAQLRAQAAQVRQAQDAATAFPALHETIEATTTAPSGGPLQVGWASSTTLQRVARHGNHGAVTEDNFPSLPVAGSVPSIQRQFAAIKSAASSAHPVTTTTTSANWSSQTGPVILTNSAAASRSGMTMRGTVPSVTAGSLHDSSAARFSQHLSNNRPENLAPDNFPALAGPARSKAVQQRLSAAGAGAKYDAAEELASRISRQNLTTGASFPSLGRAVTNNQVPSPPAPKLPPSIQDTTAFPPPPAPFNSYSAIRTKSTGSPSNIALGNVLQVPATSASLQQGEATIEEMKATMGTTRYKKLKILTKGFANDQISPQSFCDQASSLFDKGVSNPDFLRYIPLLLSSLPNTVSAQQALRYIQEMRTKLKSQTSMVPITASIAAPSGWTTPPAAVATQSWELDPPFESSSFATSQRPLTGSRPLEAQAAAAGAANISSTIGFSKKSASTMNAWGSGSSAAVLTTARVPPRIGVASAAAHEGPQTGTATRYMAQQQKQPLVSTNSAIALTKKKKKEKDELRALAFGR
jgi:hypothetical protein